MRLKRFLMDYSKWLIIGGAVVSALGAIATAIGGLMAGDKQAEETKAYNDSLKIKTDKIESLQDKLVQSQKETAETQKTGFDQNQLALGGLLTKAEDQLDKNIETFKFLTGSTSYCIVEVFPDNSGKAKVNLTHIGDYPLYDLRIKIINTTDFDLGKVNYTPRGHWIMRSEATPDVDFRHPQYVNVPFLNTGESNINVGSISCQREFYNAFSIVVTARNGVWYERFKIMPAESSYYNRAYRVMEKDPSNPESGPHNPSSLRVKKETQIPHVFPKTNYRNEKMDWFNGAMF